MSHNPLTADVCEIALDYLYAGMVPLPIRLDGSKAPDIAEWKRFQYSVPTPWAVRKWFSRHAGIAIVCGAVSHGLEVLDFDQWQTFEPWRSLIRPSLFSKLVVVETGGGGFHVIYRCEEVCGNTKLAQWEKPDCVSHKNAQTRRGCGGEPIKATRIETRGEGGYIIAAGSPLSVHSSGNPYTQVLGSPLPQVNTISPAERRELWQAAATFDCRERESQKVKTAIRRIKQQRYEATLAVRPAGDVPPWDDFDRRAAWDAILTPHGWMRATQRHWIRPGKSAGTSAIIGTNADGLEILTVFSSNADTLPPGSYGKFRAYALLNHAGGRGAAAKTLAMLGFGSCMSRRRGA